MPGVGDIAFELRELTAFPGELRKACAAFAESAGGGEIDPCAVSLPSKLADASIPLAVLGALSAPKGRVPAIRGIKAFESVSVRSSSLCFTVSAELLSLYASAAARLLPEPPVPDELLIPAKGCAADLEASGYVRSLLLARYRTGKPHVDCPESRAALLRCLLLAGGEGEPAAAVRAALSASRAGKTGGIEAAAMAALLAVYGR